MKITTLGFVISATLLSNVLLSNNVLAGVAPSKVVSPVQASAKSDYPRPEFVEGSRYKNIYNSDEKWNRLSESDKKDITQINESSKVRQVKAS